METYDDILLEMGVPEDCIPELVAMLAKKDRAASESFQAQKRAEKRGDVLAEALKMCVTSMQDSGYPNSHIAIRSARRALDN